MERVIYSAWLQGLDQAPPLVQLCLERWRSLNPDHELRVLDAAAAREQLADFPIDVDELSPQALSDVLRCSLLRAGGVWVDAATLPLAPLDSWLDTAMGGSGFFAFEAIGDRPIASWLLAAEEQHPLLAAWWEAVRAYWHRPRRLAQLQAGRVFVPSDPVATVTPPGSDGSIHPYFWFHYLFRALIERDAAVRDAWARVPKASSLPPHGLQLLCASNPNPSDAELAAAVRGTPVQKLDWRASYPLERLEATVAVTDAASSPR
jgi:hypothetical protein